MKRLTVLLCIVFPLLAQSKSPEKTMDSFRYELYAEGSAAVYYIHQTETGTTLYYREAGSLEGWRLTLTEKDAMKSFSKIWKRHRLSSKENTGLEDEDKSRDRLVVAASFGPGTEHSFINYCESPRSKEDIDLESDITACVEALLQKDTDKAQAKSKCIYSPDGQFLRRIDYDKDGKVCGGYDALDPFARF